MKKLLGILLRASLAALVILGVTGSLALAHEQRDVSKYHFTVGFFVEPAIQGQKNGLDLRVTANVSGNVTPVLGVEKTLKVEVTHVPSGITKTFDIRTIFRDPGHYTSDWILTASGYYRFHFVGTIDGTPVDETFNSKSGGGGFNDVEPSVDIEFPVAIASPKETEDVARQAQALAQKVQQDHLAMMDEFNGTTRTATIGVGLGALGIVVGAFALIMKRKAA